MSDYLSIKKLATDDRPREKLVQLGRSALSNAEILAILIGSGTREKSAIRLCQEIMASSENNINILAKKSVKDLMQFKGIGEAKAISIVAALELGRRRKTETPEEKPKISSSSIAYRFINHIFEDLNHEEFHIILLNRSNRVIKSILISKGGLSGTIADGKIIFKAAISESASGIILCHNHPSGNLKPSISDIDLTTKLVKFSKLIDLPILDHLILTDLNYYSFADNGIMPKV